MNKTINCFKCKKLSPFQDDDTKCPLCGSKNVETISEKRLNEGLESGVFFSLDDKGNRTKHKKNNNVKI